MSSKGLFSKEQIEAIDKEVLSQYSDTKEEILFDEWVDVNLKGKKFGKKLLLVGKFRMFVLKKSLFGKFGISCDLPLLDLKEIVTESDQTVKLVFSSHPTPILIKSKKLKEMLLTIRSSFRRITAGQYPLTVKVPSELLEPLPSDWVRSEADGYLDCYIAYCNYFKVPVRKEFIKFIQRLVANGSTDLNLMLCPGIDPQSEIAIDISTVILPLKYNDYFHSVELYDVPHREALHLLGIVMETNKALTKIVVRNVGANDVTTLGTSLTSNPTLPQKVEIFDLRDNQIDKGFQLLNTAIAHYTHGLTALYLDNCGLSSKSLVSLFEGFTKNPAMSITVEELSLSGNKFDDLSSDAFVTWLDKIKGYSRLKKCYLANTNIDLPKISRVLLLVVTMECWDISGNRIGDEFYNSVVDVVTASYKLNTLRLSKCHLSPRAVESIVSAIVKNKRLTDVELDLSENEFGPSGSLVLSRVIKDSNNIRTLNLADCKLKAKGVASLLDALSNSIDTLILDENVPHDEIENTCKRLGDFIAKVPLRKLSLVGSTKCQLRRSIVPLFNYIKTSQTLLELDISNNAIGDYGASELSDVIAENKSLISLHIDNNNFTITAFQAIHSAMKYNRTLYHIPFPMEDFERLPDNEKKQQAMKLWLEIQRMLDANRTEENLKKGQNRRLIGEVPPSRPAPNGTSIPFTPLAQLPQFLRTESLPSFQAQLLGKVPSVSSWKNIGTVTQSNVSASGTTNQPSTSASATASSSTQPKTPTSGAAEERAPPTEGSAQSNDKSTTEVASNTPKSSEEHESETESPKPKPQSATSEPDKGGSSATRTLSTTTPPSSSKAPTSSPRLGSRPKSQTSLSGDSEEKESQQGQESPKIKSPRKHDAKASKSPRSSGKSHTKKKSDVDKAEAKK
jgi:Ran GTPase-activating protein (RanGAP) involved in mRNA processing and transport